MLIIDCPWCGPRNQVEFRYGGQSDRTYPDNSDQLSDQQWKDYLFIRQNPKGYLYEQWCHQHGCRRWFNALRDTRNNHLITTYPLNAPKPDRPSED